MPFRPSQTCLVFRSTDLDRTARFYDEVFGIRFEKRSEGADAFLFARLSPEFAMSFNQGTPQPGSSPLVTFTLAEGGIADVAEALATRGVTIVAPLHEAPEGHGLVFRDPDAHALGFYQSGDQPLSLKGR